MSAKREREESAGDAFPSPVMPSSPAGTTQGHHVVTLSCAQSSPVAGDAAIHTAGLLASSGSAGSHAVAMGKGKPGQGSRINNSSAAEGMMRPEATVQPGDGSLKASPLKGMAARDHTAAGRQKVGLPPPKSRGGGRQGKQGESCG